MNAALIGLPQSGKTTLFSAATALAIEPYAAVEPRRAVVHVPDDRLTFLVALSKPKKVIEATMELVDVPGCSLDDAKGQSEWRHVLPTVRQADLLVIVVRDFENQAVPAYRNRIDPDADFNAVWEELIFADLDAVTTRIERIETALKKPTRMHDAEKRELAFLLRCREALESNEPLSGLTATEEERRLVSGFAYLTEKPILAVRNVSDERAGSTVQWDIPHVRESITLCASIEAEIAALDPKDRVPFLADLGVSAPARDRLIQSCYRAVGLISFLTMGPDEVRAWPIPKGATAVEAAGKIHSDLARGFIRAETVAYDDLVACADMKGAKAAGKVRKEGKTYVVADGDILNILANA